MPAQMIVVKPCPWCGALLCEEMSAPDGKGGASHWIYCRGCSASGPCADSRDESWVRWQERGRKHA